jgi:hypothetical protein
VGGEVAAHDVIVDPARLATPVNVTDVTPFSWAGERGFYDRRRTLALHLFCAGTLDSKTAPPPGDNAHDVTSGPVIGIVLHRCGMHYDPIPRLYRVGNYPIREATGMVYSSRSRRAPQAPHV